MGGVGRRRVSAVVVCEGRGVTRLLPRICLSVSVGGAEYAAGTFDAWLATDPKKDFSSSCVHMCTDCRSTIHTACGTPMAYCGSTARHQTNCCSSGCAPEPIRDRPEVGFSQRYRTAETQSNHLNLAFVSRRGAITPAFAITCTLMVHPKVTCLARAG